VGEQYLCQMNLAGSCGNYRIRKRRYFLEFLVNGSRTPQRRQATLTNLKIALSVALVLATASAASAAPKQAVRHPTTIQQHFPANVYLSFGSARPTNSVKEPSNMKIRDIGFRESLGN
jgi:hypothetical protein